MLSVHPTKPVTQLKLAVKRQDGVLVLEGEAWCYTMTSDDPLQRALQVKRRHERALLSRPNVVAVGVGFMSRGGETTEQVGIVVSVSRKLPPAELPPQALLPRELDGVPVDVVESGTLHAQ